MPINTVGDLIARLQKHPPETPVAILDGFNGGGSLRTINCGPVLDRFTPDEDCDDFIELNEGDPIVTMGYGCY
jgi:hypothetical protein